MNEIKHIHLGRQQFTVSAEAHTELREYLEAIGARVGKGSDVVEEVELRMAELLAQRGISGDKVVLPKDIAYLKEQLGEPHDFGDDEPEGSVQPAEDTTRRLFRDTDQAMVAGVAAGLGKYLGIDPIIVRILFIAAIFFGGAGILIYILLWLLVPEAKTASDRLSMQGKAATVDNLKKVVERADVPGVARRGGTAVARVLKVVGTIVLFVVGLPLIIGSALGVLWTVAVSIYLLMNGMKVGGHVVAPLGSHEIVGFIAGIVTLLTILFTMLLVGVAMVRRRWQLPAWGVAALLGVFFLSASIGGALAADVVPTVQRKVQSLHHIQTVQLSAFTTAAVTGNDINVAYIPDSQNYVQFSYYGDVDTAQLHASTTNGKLQVSAGTAAESACSSFCTDIRPGVEVDIHTTKLTNLTVNGQTFDTNGAPAQPVFFGWHPRFMHQGTVEYPPLPTQN